MKRILIIEDDTALSDGIRLALQEEGLEFVQAYTLQAAREELEKEAIDLILLDVNLPDGSGFDFLGEIQKMSNAAVIILTVKDMEMDIVTGLELGADDYITKPFSLMVLRARVKTQLRKRGELGKQPNQLIQVHEFSFDFGKMEFKKGDKKIELSKTEQKLLHIFVENPNINLSRADLVDRIWTDGAEYVDENALSVTVKRLRDKLEKDSANPEYIKTVYGIGYVWVVK